MELDYLLSDDDRVIIKILRQIDASPGEKYIDFIRLGKMKSAGKNEILFSRNRVSDKILFLISGILRGSRLINGIDYTHHFFTKHWFATDFQSYITGKPGQLAIQAITDTTYFEFRKNDLNRLQKKDDRFERLGRIIAEKAYLEMVDRFVDFQTSDLKTRYTKFLSLHPDLINSVPQKFIASYLGVAEQSLSRIRAEYKINS